MSSFDLGDERFPTNARLLTDGDTLMREPVIDLRRHHGSQRRAKGGLGQRAQVGGRAASVRALILGGSLLGESFKELRKRRAKRSRYLVNQYEL
jgi:hypothetical protein